MQLKIITKMKKNPIFENDLVKIRDETRVALQDYPGNLSKLARENGLERNWLRRFRDGEFDNVGVVMLNRVLRALSTKSTVV